VKPVAASRRPMAAPVPDATIDDRNVKDQVSHRSLAKRI
jgi:hypothetical protein